MQDKNKLEPLLKDEEEKLAFLEDLSKESKKINEKKKRRFDKATIITIVIAVIVLYCFGKTAYGFYVGFKYYDLRFEKETTHNPNKLEKVDTNSFLVKDTYSKIDIDYDNAGYSLITRFYNGNNVNLSELKEDQKLALIFANIPELNCNNPEMIISYDKLIELSRSLFNETATIESLQGIYEMTYDNFIITYNTDDNSYKITLTTCQESQEDFLVKQITSASTKGDELYIYEKFGYFKYQSENTYNVLGTTISKNPLTIYTDIDGKKAFSNYDILQTFKWTFKKGSDNSYYFVSLTLN